MVISLVMCMMRVLVVPAFLLSFSAYGARVIKSDAQKVTRGAVQQEELSLPFYSHKCIPTRAGGAVYFAAHPLHAGKSGEFSVCRLEARRDELEPLMLEKLNISSPEPEDNPLYNAGIACMDLMEPDEATAGDSERPVLVPAHSPFSICMLNSYYAESKEKRRARMIVTPPVPDAQMRVNGGIIAIAAAKDRVFYAACGRDENGKSQPFGQGGSGIGQVVLGYIDKSKEKKEDGKEGDGAQLDETPKKGEQEQENAGAVFTPLGAAEPLNISSPMVTIGGDGQQLYITDMYWDPVLSRLYVALWTRSGQGGMRSIVMGGIEKYGKKEECKNVLKLLPIAPAEAFDESDGIIGSSCVDEQRCIRKVRTLHTSTALNYLIVAGGIGGPDVSGNLVRALPLGVGDKEETRGMIASRDAVPADLFDTEQFFYARCMPGIAKEPSQMPRADDSAVVVGGGPVPAGAIFDMFVRSDAVFVAVAQAKEGSQPGLFKSRALFDREGKIVGWSAWARAAASFAEDGSVEPVVGAKFDTLNDGFTLMIPNADGSAMNIKRTEWGSDLGSAESGIAQMVSACIPAESGGVHYVTGFSQHTPGLRGITLQLCAGKGTVILMQTGRVGVNGDIIPHSADAIGGVTRYTDGKVSSKSESKAVAISGGALDGVGKIMSAEVATTGDDSWLFVGGRQGLVVLAGEDGSGFNPALEDGFAGLKEGMAFQPVGSYRRIRKVMADGLFLYVLTDKQFDRINMRTFKAGAPLEATTLASTHIAADGRGGTCFFDMVVSGKLALLASGMGLWRVGDGSDARTANGAGDLSWQLVHRAGVRLPVTQLSVATNTGRPQDLATGTGGNLYVLSSYRGLESAYVHRFGVKPLDDGAAIDGMTVRQLPDVMIKGRPSYFVKYGQHRGMIEFDGAQLTSVRNKSPRGQTMVTLSHPLYEARTGVRFVGTRNVPMAAGYEADGIISSLCRNEATGSPIMAGSFGVRINE